VPSSALGSQQHSRIPRHCVPCPKLTEAKRRREITRLPLSPRRRGYSCCDLQPHREPFPCEVPWDSYSFFQIFASSPRASGGSGEGGRGIGGENLDVSGWGAGEANGSLLVARVTAGGYSSEGGMDRLIRFVSPRRRLSSKRRLFDASVGLVSRRDLGSSVAARINSISRWIASSRFRSCVRKRSALIISTPSWVIRLPARRSRRSRMSSGRDGELPTSKRSCTAVATLLTFCPPGFEARMNSSWISPSSIEMVGVTWIMPLACPQPWHTAPERSPAHEGYERGIISDVVEGLVGGGGVAVVGGQFYGLGHGVDGRGGIAQKGVGGG
jgi:hypothetical protein